MNRLDPDSLRTLGRFGWLQRFNVVAFYLAIGGVFGSFAISCAGLETLGIFAYSFGMSLGLVLVAEKFVVLPLLKCPFCCNPFFVHKGWLGWLAKVNPHNRSCVNCGATIDPPPNAESTCEIE